MNPWLQTVLDQLGISRRTRKWRHIKAEREKMSSKQWCSVLKRDHFTCRYCGRKRPSVRLQVDHVKALTNGGKTILENLVTACATCNRGKCVDVV